MPHGAYAVNVEYAFGEGFMRALRNIIYLTVLNAAHAHLYALQKADSSVCKTGKVADETM